MLEKIVNNPSKLCYAAGSGLFVLSTAGAFIAGIYDGISGDTLLGRSSEGENYTAMAAVGAGYASQLLAAAGCSLDKENKSNIRKGEEVAIMLLVPINPLISGVCYGIGYIIGKSFQ